MSEENPYRVFVSHAWERTEEYSRLIEYLESTTNFYYRNVCDPDKAPPGINIADGRSLILEAMKEAEVFVFIADMYSKYRDWFDFEMDAAKAHDLPVVVVEHFGPKDLTEDIRSHADRVVSWNARSIEDGIRMEARHDDTKRFDMIDFDLS